MISAVSQEPLLRCAVDAAIEAGRTILAIYAEEDYGIEYKEDESPLTRADRAAHSAIMQKLDSNGAALPVLSEEGRLIPYGERSLWKRFWLVDPLDGTKEFISRNGEFTVNIALIEDGCPVLGVVYVPVLDELYFGVQGAGAYCVAGAAVSGGYASLCARVEKLPVKNGDGVFRVVGSRSHMNEETIAFIDRLREEHDAVEMVQRGSSLKICMVASGAADIYPRFGPTMEWDTAAGHAVVRAAGKCMRVAGSDEEVRYNKEDLLNPYFIVR